jgi:hypothetical protein
MKRDAIRLAAGDIAIDLDELVGDDMHGRVPVSITLQVLDEAIGAALVGAVEVVGVVVITGPNEGIVAPVDTAAVPEQQILDGLSIQEGTQDGRVCLLRHRTSSARTSPPLSRVLQPPSSLIPRVK